MVHFTIHGISEVLQYGGPSAWLWPFLKLIMAARGRECSGQPGWVRLVDFTPERGVGSFLKENQDVLTGRGGLGAG